MLHVTLEGDKYYGKNKASVRGWQVMGNNDMGRDSKDVRAVAMGETVQKKWKRQQG